MYARRSVAVVAVVVLMVTAGCGLITGEEALEFGASSATVNDQTVADSGYEEVTVTDQVVTRNVSVAGQNRQVEVTNHLAQYERRVDLGPLGSERASVFVALASPEVTVASKTLNPIAEMSERELLQQFESAYDGLDVGEGVDSQTVTALGQSTTVEKFEGTARLGESEVDVYVHVTKLDHEGDHVVAAAIHLQRLDGEERKIVALLEGLEHSGGD